jgi:pimeloyl-ACP methyl ester carboxylesterase
MATFRRIAWGALASGVLALLIVPLVIPISSSGVLSEREAAGEGATFVTVGDLEVHYEFVDHTGGTDTPPLLVLLHGFGASTYSWREVLEGLSRFGDVVAYDRPAFGFTERPLSDETDSPYGLDAQLELIRGVVTEFASPGQEVVLVGHSAGGTLAAEFAYRFPSEVDSLVLVAPALLTTGGGPGWLGFLYDIPQVDRVGPLLVGGIATSGTELLERSWHDVTLLTPDIREAYQAPLSIVNWERAFWEFTKAPRGFQVAENLETLSVPTAIMTGDDDRVVETADSERVATLISGASLSVIADSGHLPQEETPEEFLLAFAGAWEGLRGN